MLSGDLVSIWWLFSTLLDLPDIDFASLKIIDLTSGEMIGREELERRSDEALRQR